MTTYKEAGVDIKSQDEAIKRIKSLVISTRTPEVLADIGNFGGLYDIGGRHMDHPVLVSSADGAGTKVKLALITGRYDTVGQDLVNHCVNDILVQGARPLFFMDYIASEKLKPAMIEKVISGFAAACRENQMSLLGGEMAEMPGIYAKGQFDIAGFIVGIVEKSQIIDGSRIKPGDLVMGLKSSGLHTNGYSLALKVYKEAGLLEKRADELLKVHYSYLSQLKSLLPIVHGMAHITGGGLLDNIPRVLPDGCGVKIRKSSWKVPSIFQEIRELGKVPEMDMYRTFNMGIGYIVIVDKAAKIKDSIIIGEVVKGEKKVKLYS